jgi:hypothetical protein
VRTAARRAGGALGTWDRVVSVGDGAWGRADSRRARAAVRRGRRRPRADALRAAGAAAVLADLRDRAAVAAALAAAPVPTPPDGTRA